MIKFGTKAETLQVLKGKLKTALVLDAYVFTTDDWNQSPDAVCDAIKNYLRAARLFIVRSSASSEDTSESSNAGHFLSIGNIPVDDKALLFESIQKVIRSYGQNPGSEQILVQEHLVGIRMSGVAFTKDIDTGNDYYVVNYDESNSTTNTVTGGNGKDLKTFYRWKKFTGAIGNKSIEKVVSLMQELEILTGENALDIEFAIDDQDRLVLFQVRKLTGILLKNRLVEDYENFLLKIYKKVQKLNLPHPNLYGSKTVLGIMPDWNPAEIIGTKPGMLALSLYKELITDSIWAYQRNNYGYKNLRSFPLLISLFGQPYVDVRVSFNSFIPASVPDELSHKLSNYYIRQLEDYPSDHDKIEFNIVYSCTNLDLEQRISRLSEFGFTPSEINILQKALLDLTNTIIHPANGIYKKDIEKINVLDQRRQAILDSEMSQVDKIYWLIEECKRYGTLPFAGLARAAFIGMQFLKSCLNLEIISASEYDQFLGELNTVSKQLKTDHQKFQSGTLNKSEFLKKYGHLRPGTYDILSDRYDVAFDKYFAFSENQSAPNEKTSTVPFAFRKETLEKLDRALQQNKIGVNATQLIEFITTAIEAREHSKFVFTKCLSDILELIAGFGEYLSIPRSDLAHIDISVLLKLYSSVDERDVKEILMSNINQNKSLHSILLAIKLPYLITKPEDVYQFYSGNDEPNYITHKNIVAAVETQENLFNSSLEGKIVCVQSADPGFDWLFSKNIAGLITLYGGVNSHMAIRCAELRLPAIIGCGENNYKMWSTANTLEIDCGNKLVKIIN